MINRGTWESQGGQGGKEEGRDRKREIQTDKQTDTDTEIENTHDFFLCVPSAGIIGRAAMPA